MLRTELAAIAVQIAAADPRSYTSLVEAWRRCRCAELASLVELAGTRVAWPDTYRTRTQWHLAWVAAARARDPYARGGLLASLVERARTSVLGAGMMTSCLDELPAVDEPQITLPAAALLAIPAVKAWGKVHTRLLKLLAAAPDPRLLAAPALHGIDDDRVGERVTRALARLAIAFPAGVPALPTDCADAVAAIRAALATAVLPTPARAAVDSVSAMLAAIYEDPHDVGRRLVYADAVQALGDPRGELIVAQLSEDPDAEARADAIIEKHRRSLLGPLAAVVVPGTAVFEGGFLARCETQIRSAAVAAAAFTHPEWATVTHLNLGGGRGTVSPALHNLVELRGVSARTCAAVAKAELPRLEVLALVGELAPGDEYGTPDQPATRALARARGLPRLRELVIERAQAGRFAPPPRSRSAGPVNYRWILDAPFGAHLERVRVAYWCAEVVPHWCELLAAAPTLREVVIAGADVEVTLVMRNGAVRCAVRAFEPEDRLAVIAAIRAQVPRLRIEGL